MPYYVRSVLCPADLFGLEECGEYISQRGRRTAGSYFEPPEWDEEEDFEPPCDCSHKVADADAYWEEVWRRLEKEKWGPDHSDW